MACKPVEGTELRARYVVPAMLRLNAEHLTAVPYLPLHNPPFSIVGGRKTLISRNVISKTIP